MALNFGGFELGDPATALFGYELVADPHMVDVEHRQVHFGKSKRKRLVKKQRKKASNWRIIRTPKNEAYVLGRRLIAHPVIIAALEREIANRR